MTACSPMCKQWADNWGARHKSDTMSSDTAEDLKIAMRTEEAQIGMNNAKNAMHTEISYSYTGTKSTIDRATP